MIYDLRTCDSAHDFILEFMGMTLGEYVRELMVKSDNDFEVFWNRNIETIAAIDISDVKIMAFHILGSLDDCNEIKKNGLINLQDVLIGDTILSRSLRELGIVFDLKRKTVSCNGKAYNIDYEYYRRIHFHQGIDKALSQVSYRIYRDFCIDGFLVNDNIYNYGTRIHERPEFLMALGELFAEAETLEHFWEQNSVSYRVDFYTSIEQVERFNFDLDEYRDPPYEGWIDLDDDLKIKKWMLSHAIDRAVDALGEQYLYVKDRNIPPKQIVSYTKLER